MDTADLAVANSTAEIAEIYERFPRYPTESAGSKRLYWTLNGPLESSIQVTPNRYYEPGDVMEPYFRPGDAEAGVAPSWHPVSQESLIDPPVTAITARIECIESWEAIWVDLNYNLTDIKTDPMRPRANDARLEVTASGAFLTIHDYICAVHPWLMGLRERILDCLRNIGVNGPWPPDTKLIVLDFGLPPMRIRKEEEKDRWVRGHQKPTPPRGVPLSPAEREAAHLRVIERLKARSAARIRELERLRQEGNN